MKAKLTKNAIANMGKNRHVSMATLLKICEALQCSINGVVEINEFNPTPLNAQPTNTNDKDDEKWRF